MEKNIIFSELALSWKKEKCNYVKRSTMAAYSLTLENHLIPFFGNETIITEKEVQQFVLNKLASGLSQKTIRDSLIVLKMVCKYGKKHVGLISEDWKATFPTEQENTKIEVLNIENHRKLMEYVSQNFSFRNFGIQLCLSTGIRIGELCALTWNDFDLPSETIRIERTIERIYEKKEGGKATELVVSTPKTANSCREIPLSRDVVRKLRPLLKIVRQDFYVLSNDIRPIEPRTFRNYHRWLLHKLNIPYVKFHALRHTFATRCIESGCDYKTVSVLLGHANISTTLDLYVHPNHEQKKKCIEMMHKKSGLM